MKMTGDRPLDVRNDVDPTDGRDESLNERMDRNWNEILQELRVTQTGTQIFTGFLLTIAFQTRFNELTTFQVRVYLVLVVAAVLTTALGLAPVNMHRALFREGQKVIIVQAAHIIMRITLVGVAVMLIGTVLLIFDLVLDRSAALIAAGAILLLLIVLAVLPRVLRSNGSPEKDQNHHKGLKGDEYARQEEARP
jgi:Na+/H+-dicarboxylate symporter